MDACTAIHVTIPVVISRDSHVLVRAAIRNNLIIIMPSNVINITEPIKPNFSAYIAKIESVVVSGKYPYAWTLLPTPKPIKPPLPTAINAWQA